jgi:hypothetical protein
VPSGYRTTRSITAVIFQGSRERLRTIDPGSLLTSTCITDAVGMIEATCDGKRVRIFARDLAERSKRIKPEAVKA